MKEGRVGVRVEESFVGGAPFPWSVRVGWPLALLEVEEKTLTFRLRFGLGRFFGPWTLYRENIRTVRNVSPPSFSPGIKITDSAGNVWTFWGGHPADVLAALRGCGYPVTPDRGKAGRNPS